MAYYHTCPDCGANLDPGEKCDCQTNKIYITKEANTNVRNESNDHGYHGPYGSAQQHCRREVWRHTAGNADNRKNNRSCQPAVLVFA